MAGPIEIKKFDARNRKMIKEFIMIPWTLKIYDNDPCWIPPIIHEQKKFFHPDKGYFFEVGEAAFFIAYRDGKPVGRVTAHINSLYEKKYDNDTGFFGHFESINDKAIAQALFDAAAGWLKEKKKTVMQGPQSFSIYDAVGFEVHGENVMPVIGLFHLAAYYKDLAVACGFEKTIDWSCYLVKKIEDYKPYLKAVRDEYMKSQTDLEYSIFDKKDFPRRRKDVLEIFNTAWEGNWGHLPLTQKQFDMLIDELVQIVVPELVIFAEDKKSKKTIGFIISIPDVNHIFRIINGHLYPWRIIRALLAAKKTKKLRTIIMGVLPTYRGRKIDDVFYLRTIEDGIGLGFEASDCSLIVETNFKMIGALKPLKAENYKTYRIYQKKI
jgi:hypothetical protein